MLGLALFFADQSAHSTLGSGRYALGSGLVVIAAVVWAAYALIQKQLLTRLSSSAILLFIYLVASVLLLPLAQPSHLLHLAPRYWWLLGYCALNTLVAYGAFAEALAHWQASRVSTILATTPLLSLAVIWWVHWIAPGAIAPEHVSVLGYAGAVLVVAGSAMSSLLGNKPEQAT